MPQHETLYIVIENDYVLLKIWLAVKIKPWLCGKWQENYLWKLV